MNKITAKIHSMLKRYNKKCISPFSINCGNCDIFAQELQEAFPRGRMIWGEDWPEVFTTKVDPFGHCFFKYGKKYYDSESPYGEASPSDLQYYKRQEQTNLASR